MEAKAERIPLRATRSEKALLARAARLAHQSLSEFVVSRACAAAEATLAERTRFELSTERWEAFELALDAPAREVPELRRLMSEPSVFE